MNALWISRMCAYLHSERRIESARSIVAFKIAREDALLRRFGRRAYAPVSRARTIEEVLLVEARAARHFWREFRTLLPLYPDFSGRAPKRMDTVNRLLDIGYHHLANTVHKILSRLDIPEAMGIIHSPRTAESSPLSYDLMELFRADTVNAELLRFLRLKKKRIGTLGQREISHFLHDLNERMERRHYIRAFGACHAYRYYMELQILKFVSAVNHRGVFEPILLPVRHDSRCTRLDTKAVPVVQSSTVPVP